MQGKFIGVKEDANTFVIEKKFFAEKTVKAVLRATALGLYFAQINGERVGDSYLTPGWTSYNKMLQVQSYDVTSLVREGENVLSLTVNTGWYRGGLVWNRITDTYGEHSAVCAELNVNGAILATDESWIARESHIRESGIYDGEVQDFTAELKPLTAVAVYYDKSRLVEQLCEPVRNIERLPAIKVFRTPKNELVYDFGQNLTGVVQIQTPDHFDGTISLRFAEILVDGNFYTENLRSAKATDVFRVTGAKRLSPEFTFHGFRYMKLEGAELPAEYTTALVRHTDMARTGYIQTSNHRFNRLMENIVWGQKDNFVDIPTDCPQRDERLGWTGDINAFCRTAAYNFDVRKILRKWLADVRNDQAETGEIPFVAPDCLNAKHTDAMWCDAIAMVPWTLYEMYGDISFLSDNFEAMKKFIAARKRTMVNGLIAKGHEFGDWLALDGEEIIGSGVIGRTDVYYITNVLHANTLRIATETAKLLGDAQCEHIYRTEYSRHLHRIRREYFTANGRLALDTITAQVLALQFNIVPDACRGRLAATLNDNVVKHGYRVVTGFVGTPYLLFALADHGYFETARRVMLNNAYPGWLYEVDMGATTVWERWNSLMPDGTPNPDGMNSYNHYAYGAMMEFAYRRVAGIEALAPGFRRVKISPTPTKGLERVRADFTCVHGKIVAGYEQINEKITFFAEIPEGVEAEIILPNERPIFVNHGSYSYQREWERLACDPFIPQSLVNEVFENPRAVKAFNEAFGGIFTGSEIAWMRGDKTLQFMAEFRDQEGKMKLSEFSGMLERANRLFLQEPRA